MLPKVVLGFGTCSNPRYRLLELCSIRNCLLSCTCQTFNHNSLFSQRSTVRLHKFYSDKVKAVWLLPGDTTIECSVDIIENHTSCIISSSHQDRALNRLTERGRNCTIWCWNDHNSDHSHSASWPCFLSSPAFKINKLSQSQKNFTAHILFLEVDQ